MPNTVVTDSDEIAELLSGAKVRAVRITDDGIITEIRLSKANLALPWIRITGSAILETVDE